MSYVCIKTMVQLHGDNPCMRLPWANLVVRSWLDKFGVQMFGQAQMDWLPRGTSRRPWRGSKNASATMWSCTSSMGSCSRRSRRARA